MQNAHYIELDGFHLAQVAQRFMLELEFQMYCIKPQLYHQAGLDHLRKILVLLVDQVGLRLPMTELDFSTEADQEKKCHATISLS